MICFLGSLLSVAMLEMSIKLSSSLLMVAHTHCKVRFMSSNILRLLFMFVMKLTLTMIHTNSSPRDPPLPILVNKIRNHAGILVWFLIWFQQFPVYQIRIYISCDDMSQTCSKIYRNSENLIPDSRITNCTYFASDFTWFLNPLT